MTVGNGDTFMAVMIKAGATSQDAHLAIESMRKLFNPRKLRRNQIITVIFRPATRTATTGRLVGLHFDPTVEQIIRVSLTDDRYTAEAHKRILDVQDAVVSGTIKSSLYMAAIKVGLPPAVLVKLIRLLSWDVDFQRDIQKGDRFTVLTERLHHKDGRIARWGDIQHAELVLSGKPVRIYRYKTKRNGVEYFDEKGRSAQKALMKTPIDGARLSSRFGRRKHPILGYTRMHKGIDFAAPRGTPIYAAGNGTVTYAGRKGGYGKYVQIRHNGTFETAYAHMKGFGRGVRRGRRVRQGQIIGYVGSTGRSTGPHLHYEVRRGGRQVNPLRIKLPSGRKLAGAELKRFTRFRSQLDTRLAAVPSKTRYADATR
jgi:murein DD-endopeptidase MepM/ murein hydrolase activator NlpD